MSKLILLLLFIFQFSVSFSQDYINVIDSIKKEVNNSKHDTSVISNFIKLSIIYRDRNTDSSFLYVNKANEIFINAVSIDENQKDTIELSLLNNYGLTNLQFGNYDTSEYYFNKLLNKAQRMKFQASILSSYINLGSLYEFRGNNERALFYHLKALKIAEGTGDIDDLATTNNNVGIVHYNLENYDKALVYYEKSKKYKIQKNDIDGIALANNNIAIIYYFKDDIDKSIEFFKQAASTWKKDGNIRRTAMVISNLGELYLEIGLNKFAINYLLEADSLYTVLKDYYNVVSTNKLIGKVYFEGGKYKKADKYFRKAISISNRIGESKENIDLYKYMAELDSATQNYKSAFENFKKFYNLNDSLFSVERKKAFDELQTKYDTEKKEQQIILNEQQMDFDKQQIKKQKLFNWVLSFGIFLILIVAVLYIRQNIIRKKANQMLMLKNAEILQQKEEIETQRDEIQTQNEEIVTQRDLAASQRDLISKQKESITDSIRYAKRIQEAVLPQNTMLDKLLSDYFVLYMPKDVVSGDFYWIKKYNNLTILLVADCTGHGVPGGFMSMLGIAFLNEIVKKPEVKSSSDMLNELRDYIIYTLKQTGGFDDQPDGMDVSICVFDENTSEIQYSGAFNSIYIVSENELITSENTIVKECEHKMLGNDKYSLYEIKPDKMPIAHYAIMDSFKTKTIKVTTGDTIYLFSDGYPDQFGGKRNRKYNYKRFKSMLLNNSQTPMGTQKEILLKEIKQWQGKESQIDDITVLGVRV